MCVSVGVCICVRSAPFAVAAPKNAHKHNHTRKRVKKHERRKGKQIQYKIELLNVCFTINNQQSKSNTLDGIQDDTNKLAENTRSTHAAM